MRINYEIDPSKHYVRQNGWLEAAKQQKQTIRKRLKNIPLRYFTFCAAEAIDVFMLEREQILKRSEETERLEGVYFCEEDEESFGKIAELIGSPEQGFRGEFERIVLFKDDEETHGKTLTDEDFYRPEIRKKLGYKDAHQRLCKAFPFDIINLDVCGVMFPPRKNVIAPLMESIIQILKWQTRSKFSNDRECDQFTLFLTSHIDPDNTNQQAIEQLKNRVNDNLRNTDFHAAFVEKYGHNQVRKLMSEKFPEFFCLALPKFIIHETLFSLGWKVTCGPTYLYNRDYSREDKQYQIMHTIGVYERIPDSRERLDFPQSQYIQSVTQLINNGVEWIDNIIKDPDVCRQLKQDLTKIVELRKARSGI